MEKYAARASVHTIVDYALMGGDLMPAASAERLLEGVRGHRSLQSFDEEGVRNELAVRCTVESEHVSLTVYGRIDRLYALNTIEEIKTVLGDAPEQGDPAHWAQAECYAHMLCLQEDIPFIDVRLTYLNLTNGDLTRCTRTRTREQLAQAFNRYVQPYLAHLERQFAHRIALKSEMQALSFPYEHYRTGQRELAAEIFRTIRDKKMLLAQAPTGTGKTMATLFPALKGIGEGCVERGRLPLTHCSCFPRVNCARSPSMQGIRCVLTARPSAARGCVKGNSGITTGCPMPLRLHGSAEVCLTARLSVHWQTNSGFVRLNCHWTCRWNAM